MSKVSSEQFALTYLMAALRMEFSNSSVKRLRKLLSSVDDMFCMEEMLVMFLSGQ